MREPDLEEGRRLLDHRETVGMDLAPEWDDWLRRNGASLLLLLHAAKHRLMVIDTWMADGVPLIQGRAMARDQLVEWRKDLGVRNSAPLGADSVCGPEGDR